MSRAHATTNIDEYSIRTIVVAAFGLLLASITFRHWLAIPGYAAILIVGLSVLSKLKNAVEEEGECD